VNCTSGFEWATPSSEAAFCGAGKEDLVDDMMILWFSECLSCVR
jgi:hypothetical protein